MSHPRPEKPPLWTVTAFYGALALIALVWDAYRTDVSEVIFWSTSTAPRDALIGIGAGALVVALSRLLEATWAPARRLASELHRQIGPLSNGDVLVYALTSSVAEEIFFRGAMQPALGWVATSIVFGVLHGGFTPRLWFWSLFALAMGFLLGWVALWTGNLLAPILTHFVTNLCNLRALGRLKGAEAA